MIRRGSRLLILGCWSLLCVTGLSLRLLALQLFSQGGDGLGEAARLRAVRTHRWARGAAHILGMRLRSRGPTPASGTLWAANHLGYLDIVTLAALAPVRFVSKSEVAQWPVLGVLARLNGALFLDRGRPRDALRVSEAIEASLARGVSVVIFPEGTSSDGAALLPFKPALFDAAAAGGYRVRPMALRYRKPGGGSAASLCWFGDREFVPHFWNLLGLPGFVARIDISPVSLMGAHRGQLARCAEDTVRRLGRFAGESTWPGPLVDLKVGETKIAS